MKITSLALQINKVIIATESIILIGNDNTNNDILPAKYTVYLFCDLKIVNFTPNIIVTTTLTSNKSISKAFVK